MCTTEYTERRLRLLAMAYWYSNTFKPSILDAIMKRKVGNSKGSLTKYDTLSKVTHLVGWLSSWYMATECEPEECDCAFFDCLKEKFRCLGVDISTPLGLVGYCCPLIDPSLVLDPATIVILGDCDPAPYPIGHTVILS